MVHEQNVKRSGGTHTVASFGHSGNKGHGGPKGFGGRKRPYSQNDTIPGKPFEGGYNGGAGHNGGSNKRMRGNGSKGGNTPQKGEFLGTCYKCRQPGHMAKECKPQ
ncbi:hypothetical protein DUNSADRAFT_17571 [Dunaliella salina]|uniref:CCHC-type domain-containing protein n=1 Tax=Dunaliella salina TaxID=3046 RepID=A0ABQ7G1K2_DUNSA|nr:hypothetical protein DUNSADRAFT_17571 [Dunaliella salina]|eukprot:KAF5828474.1 hypothetical protein DUNSADRAFT_17571 [Dunaliella salina]